MHVMRCCHNAATTPVHSCTNNDGPPPHNKQHFCSHCCPRITSSTPHSSQPTRLSWLGSPVDGV